MTVLTAVTPAHPVPPFALDTRYQRVDSLIETLKRRDSVAYALQVDGARHRIEWPVDFSAYQVLASTTPVSLGLATRGDFPELERLRPHLLRGGFDLLTYYTCSTRSVRYLQNSQDRMDWFFALDAFVDGQDLSAEQRTDVVRDLCAWLGDRGHQSQTRWVNTLNAMLRVILEDLEGDGIDTSRLIQDTRGYFEGFLLEFDPTVTLPRYLENRALTIGMRPEVEFCFAYSGLTLSPEERRVGERMKELAAHLVALQNDALSQSKEEAQEQGHLNLKAYFPEPQPYVEALNGLYRTRYDALRSLRPGRPGPLEVLWNICAQWVCGSLVWHLTTPRYDLGQFELLA